MPAGNFIVALVGANTVNGPALLKASTNSPAFTAVTNVVWSLLPTAICTIFGFDMSSTTRLSHRLSRICFVTSSIVCCRLWCIWTRVVPRTQTAIIPFIICFILHGFCFTNWLRNLQLMPDNNQPKTNFYKSDIFVRVIIFLVLPNESTNNNVPDIVWFVPSFSFSLYIVPQERDLSPKRISSTGTR